MSEEIVVLANPSSSGFTAGLLRKVMGTLDDRATVVWPTDPDATRRLAGEAAGRGCTVVAMGGDGMVHHVARGVVGSPGRLGIVPVGTTNVLARLLGIPADPVDAARILLGATTARAPLAEARWTAESGERRSRPVVFSLGIGWDAEVVVAAEAEPYRKATGGLRLYARAALTQLRREVGRLPDLVVSADDPTMSGTGIALQVQLHDTYTFAGPARLRLGPAPDGAMLAATWRRLRGVALIPMTLTAMRAEGLGGHADVDVARVQRVDVEATRPVRLQIDGEPLGRLTDASVAFDPQGLAVAVPD